MLSDEIRSLRFRLCILIGRWTSAMDRGSLVEARKSRKVFINLDSW
jgi:hypothetical protein